MGTLLQDYFPLVVFIGVALVIGLALLIAPFIVAYSAARTRKSSRPTNAASTPSTMRA